MKKAVVMHVIRSTEDDTNQATIDLMENPKNVYNTVPMKLSTLSILSLS